MYVVYVYFFLTELTRLVSGSARIAATPFQPNVYYYENAEGQNNRLPNSYTVAVEDGYIIGAIINSSLHPLLGHISGHFKRVKILISDNRNIPISSSDPMNRLFFHNIVNSHYHTRLAEVPPRPRLWSMDARLWYGFL